MKQFINLWSPGFVSFGGGITAFSREFGTALMKSGYRLHFFGKADNDGVLGGFPLSGGRGKTWRFAAKGVLATLRDKPTQIVSTHLNFGPAVFWASRLSGCPYALVAHGIDVHADLSPSRLLALRRADQLLAVSQWTRDRLLALRGIDAAKVTVLPNTYDDARFVPGVYPAELAARYGLRSGEKVILTVARLDAGEGYKGYDRILEALPEVRRECGPVRYLVVGKGEDRERLERMAEALGVAEAVTFAGFVPDEELADYYRLADVFAMPSTGEGFGIVFLEAMGCGTPALGGNRDGSVDALDEGRLGSLVDPLSVEEITHGLIRLLRGEGKECWFDRNALSEAVKKRYGREAFRRRVCSIFTA